MIEETKEDTQEIEKKGITAVIIDGLFAIKRKTIILIMIFILAFILRLIAAINLSVSADDMHHVTNAINFLYAGKLITYDQSSGLWYALTSVIYNILGTTQLSSRMVALIFGSLSVLVIYLLTKEFFNEKIALLASFLLAIAPFHILNTMPEQDVMAMFFALTGMLFFIKSFKTNKKIFYIISGIFIGLAVYTKVYPLLFVPSLLLFFIYSKKKEKKKIISKYNAKRILIFLLVIFIFTLPALTHNYLLYKYKGFMDLQFTRTLGLGKNISTKFYSWDHQFDAKNDWKGLILGHSQHSASLNPTIFVTANFIRLGDPINFYLGIIGIILILLYRKEYRKYLIFLLLNILFIFPFLASVIILPKHYLFLELFLIPTSALALNNICNKISNKVKFIPLIMLFILSLILLGLAYIPNVYNPDMHSFYGKSHIAQMIEFKEKNILPNALIVADSRIYRGRINWVFQGRSYLEASDFVSLLAKKNELPGKDISVDIYFFECIKDDCGWGTIKDQPDFNTTMEAIVQLFQKSGTLVETISEPLEEKPYYPILIGERDDIINVYHGKMNLRDSVISIANQPKNWFLYDIGYEPIENQFDYYKSEGFFDVLLDKIAHFVVWIAVITAFLSPIYIIHFLRKDETINNRSGI